MAETFTYASLSESSENGGVSATSITSEQLELLAVEKQTLWLKHLSANLSDGSVNGG